MNNVRLSRGSISRQTWADLFCLGLLLLLPAFFFWREALGRRGLGDQDAAFWFFPIYKFFVTSVRNGKLPLWYPDQYGGVPIFAQWQGGLLDPFNWVHLAGPTSQTLTVSFLLAIALALVGTWWYARLVGLNRRASLVTAIVYGLNGFVVARTIYPVFIHVIALFPLILALTEKLYGDSRWGYVVPGALVVAWQVFAGHPQPLVYSSLVVIAYSIFRVLTGGGPRRRLRLFLIKIGVTYLLGAGLAAVQLLPAAQVAGRSMRQAWTFEMFSLHSIHPITLLTAIIPYFQGGGSGIYRMPYWGISWHHNEEQLYLGVLAIALAAGGCILSVRRKELIGIFWAGTALVGLLLAMGKHVGPLARIVYQLPVLGQFRGANRHWLEVSMAIAMLSGIAVNHLLHQPLHLDKYFKAVVRTVTVLLTGLTAICSAWGLLYRESAEVRLRSVTGWQEVPAGFLASAGMELLVPLGVGLLITATLWLWTSVWHRAGIYYLALAILLVDYHLYALSAPIGHSDRLETQVGRAFPGNPPEISNDERMARSHIMLTPERGEFSPLWFAGHRMVTGYDPLVDRRYREFSGVNEAGHTWQRTILLSRDRTLDLLSTRYLIVPTDQGGGEAVSVAPLELASQRSLRGLIPKGSGDTIVVETRREPGEAPEVRLICGPRLISVTTLRDDYPLSQIELPSDVAECTQPVEVTILNRGVRPILVSGLWIVNTQTGRRESILTDDPNLMADLRSNPRRWREIGPLGPPSPWSGYYQFENLTALPPAWLVDQVEEAWEGDQLKLIRGEIRDRVGQLFDPQRTVLVDMNPGQLWYQPFLNSAPGRASSPGNATVTEFQPDRLTIEVNADRPAILVVTELADSDWKATIDGLPATWHRVNYILRGLPVAAGTHFVSFTYHPIRLKTGAVVSMLSLLVLAILFTAGLPRAYRGLIAGRRGRNCPR
ncbi:MAG: hypothetical protein EBU88_07755 [Acidobacteria bacterium]|nr:hypothetical protein [Acidobacteriota bacterium]